MGGYLQQPHDDHGGDSISTIIGAGPTSGIWTSIPVILIGGYLLWKTDWKTLLTPRIKSMV